MSKLEKFKNESLALNEALNVKGGALLGGDNTGCSDKVITNASSADYDVTYHRYNDNGSYNGFELAFTVKTSGSTRVL